MQWIKCSEKLPENNDDVLVYGLLENQETKDIYKATFHKSVNEQFGNDQFWESEWAYDIDVSHWMPLPDAPKE